MLEILCLLGVFICLLFMPLPPLLLFLVAVCTLPAIYMAAQNAPFLPFPRKNLQAIFCYLQENHKLKDKHFVDLGCGDGRVLQLASQAQLKASGYEISFLTYLLAKFVTRKDPNISIFLQDFWKVDFQQCDIIYTFAQKKPMLKFAKEVWPNLKSQTVVISAAFRMHGVKPDHIGDGYFVYIKP